VYDFMDDRLAARASPRAQTIVDANNPSLLAALVIVEFFIQQ